jgi:hypothetical protein
MESELIERNQELLAVLTVLNDTYELSPAQQDIIARLQKINNYE